MGLTGARLSALVLVALVALGSPPARAERGVLQLSPAGGVARDFYTRQPLAGARLLVDCDLTLFDSTLNKRHVEKTTDEDGRYELTMTDLLGCNMANWEMRKPGYVPAGNGPVRGFPSEVLMVREQDKLRFTLQSMVPPALDAVLHGEPTGKPGEARFVPDWVASYMRWYTVFLKANDLAREPRDQAFVREKFCGPLAKLYEALPAAARRAGYDLATGRPGVLPFPQEYESQVLPRCQPPAK
jgi:hypothetical protein